jgi:hypothetical protein
MKSVIKISLNAHVGFYDLAGAWMKARDARKAACIFYSCQ